MVFSYHADPWVPTRSVRPMVYGPTRLLANLFEKYIRVGGAKSTKAIFAHVNWVLQETLSLTTNYPSVDVELITFIRI